MKIYINNRFQGYNPVGAAAVVIADSKKEACKMLQAELPLLAKWIEPNQFEEIKTDEKRAYVLQDGDY